MTQSTLPGPSSSPLPRPLRIERLDPRVMEILRRMTPAERMQRMVEMNEYVRARLIAHLQHKHPDWPQEKIHTVLLQRLGYESD